jgi:alkylresorcinol/alkylpyrone synthase
MPPRLRAIATAVPPYAIDQDDAVALVHELYGDAALRLGPIHANAGIERRWSCVPAAWYRHHHGWRERSALFVENALILAEQAIRRCLDDAALGVNQIDAIVAVSTTGICTPSLDALLIERLGLRPDVTRLPIFGLGCAGGVLGLGRAATLAANMPGRNVLLLVVELCGLTFRPQDHSPGNIVATALFGDGCAAALLSTEGDGSGIAAWGEHTWPHSLDIMGWRVEDDGLGVLFSRDIPPVIERHFAAALDGWLETLGLARSNIGRFYCHPGGAKVVNALENAIGLPDGTLDIERDVLRQFGNMSAATALFVLQQGLRRPQPPHAVVTALGPGFTAGFALLTP